MSKGKQRDTSMDDASPSGRTEDELALARVVYVGHVPHGFFEKQMLGYFSQFGKVTRLRLSRSKKTGNAKGYAFLEFQYPEVARVAAEAMDGYFLFKQRLKCKLIPPSRVHPQLFQGANRRFKVIPWRRVERQRHDRERTPTEHAQRVAKLVRKDKQRQKKIKEAGIDFEYEGLHKPMQPKKIVFE
ncbi:hypothetical protein VOLCADRAFT_80307 [Volvox carteri f. nagariensis]|uniref:RRM domain-containing protein n=1 Tax=Volvox carteri f. nagariensis TaxID=3068 RepID=D8TQJ3_VOLCA|nr:uncharacterized protein VOLCADRAFT_80307 [Volvox carteri f. nagariensis]EFJ50163.1 hypothetical protein VOLCADRAFT_80307 [Volvox carteri f. nagariensis]|eukprot:XP_002948783.1 hypothetical protein VOLCADRAFT_80307 [Volvox carteri f. nagariensis]